MKQYILAHYISSNIDIPDNNENNGNTNNNGNNENNDNNEKTIIKYQLTYKGDNSAYETINGTYTIIIADAKLSDGRYSVSGDTKWRCIWKRSR
jgi:hypothetical protein